MRSKTQEKNLWAWLRKISTTHDYITLHRIENTLSRSTPDVVAAVGSIMVFIELKTTHRPARSTTPIRPRFQQGQSSFLYYWSLRHDAAFLLLQVGSGVDARRYLLTGRAARAIEAGAVTEAELQTLALIDPKATAEEILRQAATETWLRAEGGP